MNPQTENTFGRWRNQGKPENAVELQIETWVTPGQIIRFFILRKFLFVCFISACFALALSHFMTRVIVQRDAELTGQFVSNIAAGHGQQIELVNILDERTDLLQLGIGAATADVVRKQFFDHLNFLPDMTSASVYAADHKAIWSTSATLIGKIDDTNNELAQVFKSREMVSRDALGLANQIERQTVSSDKSSANAHQFSVETLTPLFDANGSVIAVVEIHKDPKSLLDSIHRAYLLIWLSTALTVVGLQLVLFFINRRANQKAVEKQLSEVGFYGRAS